MKLKRFDEFILERKLTYSETRQLMLFSNVDLDESDEKILNRVFHRLLNSNMITNEDRKCVFALVGSKEMINENFSEMINEEAFWDKLRDRFPKAAEVSDMIKDKGEKILKKVIDKAKNAMSFVKNIISGLKDLITKFFKTAKDWVIKQFKNGALKDKMKSLNDKEKDGLKKDLKTGREVSKWYRKEFAKKTLSQAQKNVADFVTNEQEPIAENINLDELNEGKNVISTFIHGLESIPPFSWLHKLAKAGEAGANKLFEILSQLTQKLGGPKFELPVIAALAGIVIEQFIKTDVGHWLIHLVGAGTGLGIAIKGIKMVALCIAVIVALDEIFGNKIMGKHEKGHGEEAEASPAEATETEGSEKPEQSGTEQVEGAPQPA